MVLVKTEETCIDTSESSPLLNKYKTVKKHFGKVSFRGANVLDVGGSGKSRHAVKETFESEEVLSLNIEPSEVTGAASSVIGDATRLPFKDESWDVVTSFDTIEHLLVPDDFLLESFRVLKKGGWLVIETPNLADIYSRLFFALGYNPIQYNPSRLRVAVPFRSVQKGDMGHKSVFTYRAMKEILSAMGFAIDGTYGFDTVDYLEDQLRVYSLTPGRISDETQRAELRRFSRSRKLLGKILPPNLSESMLFVARKPL